MNLRDGGGQGVENLTISLEYEPPQFDEKFTKFDVSENIVNKKT